MNHHWTWRLDVIFRMIVGVSSGTTSKFFSDTNAWFSVFEVMNATACWFFEGRAWTRSCLGADTRSSGLDKRSLAFVGRLSMLKVRSRIILEALCILSEATSQRVEILRPTSEMSSICKVKKYVNGKSQQAAWGTIGPYYVYYFRELRLRDFQLCNSF